MDEAEFKKLINKNKFQVLVLSSPIPRPASFIIHTWIVTIKNGEINRWEFGRFDSSNYENKTGVHKNLFKPWTGMNKNPFSSNSRFKAKLVSSISGGKNSIAKKMVEFIEKNAFSVPFVNNFSNFGPNCNTFVQWIINKFPESNLKLPLTALGKGYKK